MAQVKYYKKLSPGVPVVIGQSGGQTPIEFTSLNGVVGYYATDQDFVQQELARAMREQRYGITEITPEEFFADYVEEKKKAGTAPKAWREELSRSASHLASDPVGRLGSESAQAALRASGSSDIRTNKRNLEPVATSMEAATPSPAQLPVTIAEDSSAQPAAPAKFVPSVGKRKQARK